MLPQAQLDRLNFTMPRYPSAMFGRRIPPKEFEQSRHHYAPFVLRDFSDPERCRELARLCEVLFAWADRFRAGSPQAFIYAGAVSDDQIDRFFEHIEQECRRLAPMSGGLNLPLVSGGWQAELSGHIGSIEAINRLLTGDVVWEPASVDTRRGEPVGEWEKRRQPASDSDIAEMVVHYDAPAVTLRAFDQTQATQVHERLAELARGAIDEFLKKISQPTYVGGLSSIKKILQTSDSPAACGAAIEYRASLETLAAMAGQAGPGVWDRHAWRNAVRRLLLARDGFTIHCWPLLGKDRSDRQAKKKAALRDLGVCLQYANLIGGNVQSQRVLVAIDAIGAIANRALKLLRENCGVRRNTMTPGTLDKEVRQMDRLLVDPEVVERWKAGLTRNARQCGRIIQVLSGSGSEVPELWTPGDVIGVLRKAGVISVSGRGAKDTLDAQLDLMVPVGLAMQVPWDVVDPTRPLPKRLRLDGMGHRQKPWVINAIGAILVD